MSRVNRPILLALFDGGRPKYSLSRAVALGRTLEAKVHVLRVVFGRWPLSMATSQLDLLTVLRSTEHLAQSDLSLRHWLAEAHSGWAPDDVCTRSGDFVGHVATRASEIDASLIVMPPIGRRCGEVAVKLACVARLPVLVAREAACEQGIVVATDLEDPTYPVLRAAMSLGQRLELPLVAIHNVSPLTPLIGTEPASVALPDMARSPAGERRERLDHALSLFGGQTTVVMADEVDPVHAILREVQARNAALVTVGTRRRSWLERLLFSSVAARVINGTERSVLVVPIARERPARDTAQAGL